MSHKPGSVSPITEQRGDYCENDMSAERNYCQRPSRKYDRRRKLLGYSDELSPASKNEPCLPYNLVKQAAVMQLHVRCFNTPCTLVDVTVGNFLRMCLVGMKSVRYLSILWNQYSIIWIEIRSGEADSRVSDGLHADRRQSQRPGTHNTACQNFSRLLELEALMLHHDNASSRTAAPTVKILEENNIVVLEYPSCSSDLATCDFWLFFKLK
ncbi:hypothetical protein EVAR_62456_1 [Eumeta japonica]|uniref:Mariner Mos1 transposase n=1 Tax=Eumeta variegata TaxID=151549 RepID=A0A4C1ZNP9_EUMVA|nr:hypothetical protein EVAR_62456_1 [Eumeta japonica]